MLTSELDYHLPEELIATHPVEPRDACRLMVVSRSDPGRIEHRRFRDLPEYLRPGDVMVFNTSGVLPAKIQGRRVHPALPEGIGAAVEGLFIRASQPGRWELMLKTGTRLVPGLEIDLHDAHGGATGVRLRLAERLEDRWAAEVVDGASGARIERPEAEVLARVGATPLPPYIRKARRDRGDQTDDDLDRGWYQCVYAESVSGGSPGRGSVAAPTAGLHFTPALLERIGALGVTRADVRLDVGIGTFKPVSAERIEDHPIHSEWIDVPPAAVRAVERAHAAGNRVFAVGTTAVRSLESLPSPLTDAERNNGYQADTRLYVMPGFRFRHVDGLVTNFHLPRSTLLAMVGAMFESGGVEGGGVEGRGTPEAESAGSGVARLLGLYREAVREGYRFYSYGDAMLVLP